ncbi:Der1-like protein, partial [Rhodotorula sp. JG-1b]
MTGPVQLAKIPPFTRSVVGGILAVTLPVLLQLVSPYRIAFLPDRIANHFELWRLVTPFLYGGGGLNLVFSLIMMYRSLNDLEDGHFAMRLTDMTWAFILIGLGIIGLNTPLETPFLFSPFMMAVTHLVSILFMLHLLRRVNLYGLITVPAPYFPFAMLGFDLLNGGPGAVLRSFTGMVAAHAYYY